MLCCILFHVLFNAIPDKTAQQAVVLAGRVNGAVTFPVPVPEQVAAGLQSGPFASLLGAAGIRYAAHLAYKLVQVDEVYHGPISGKGQFADQSLTVCKCRLNTDDTQKGLTLQGPLAGFVRRAAYLYRQPTDQHRFRVGRDWVQSAIDNAQTTLSRSRRA